MGYFEGSLLLRVTKVRFHDKTFSDTRIKSKDIYCCHEYGVHVELCSFAFCFVSGMF